MYCIHTSLISAYCKSSIVHEKTNAPIHVKDILCSGGNAIRISHIERLNVDPLLDAQSSASCIRRED
ncbi:hypothetical protein BBG47_09015 [Paenibacillus sp. KS1]|nr:hypothetical protein BBG47_09015 [Paenibacillus sp. KS1]